MILLGLLASDLVAAPSATSTQLPLSQLVALVEPYVKCRADADRRIVALQQQLQSRELDKQARSEEYDIQSDPFYHELREINYQAQEKCDLPKYVSLINSTWNKTSRYNDWEREKLAEFFISDIVRVKWSYLNSQGAFEFPKIIATGPKK